MKTKKPKILLTSALPYANGSIHIGHLVEYIQTDIYSRFLKLTGEDIIYCCADDAHGTAIQIRAEKDGITPEELITKVNKEHQEDFKLFHIAFDNYHSTHSPENEKLATEIFSRLQKKGLIYTKEIESFYDEEAKRFLPDRYIKGKCPKCDAVDQYGDVCEKCNATYKPTDLVNPYSTLTNSKPIRKKTTHYFFKLAEMTDKLKEYFKEQKFQPEVTNYLNNWIEEGLQDWDISRDGPYFGFKIPGEEDKYFYVWLDAPIGYLASCKNYCDKHNLDSNEYFHGDTKMIHIIGKDIMYFHYLFWPAMLMAADFNVPHDIITHGFLTVNKEKMSKSRGTFILAREFAEMYPAEYLRYYYAKVLSRKMADIDLDFNHFIESVNAEIVGNVGNLCYRALSFLDRNFEGKTTNFDDNEYPVLKEIDKKIEIIKEHYTNLNFNRAIAEIMEVSSLGNKFFQDNAPWQLIKENKKDEAHIVCSVCVNIAYIVASLIAPIMPIFSKKVLEQINTEKKTWDSITYDLKNHSINKPEIIVTKIEKHKEKLFTPNLKVAKVLDAKKHPDSEKLIVLQIDVGDEKRLLVAGLQKYYKPEELINTQIIVVSNLKPAKLGGIESQGMLLAASTKDDSVVKVIHPEGKPGDEVTCAAMKNNTAQIKIDEFFAVPLKVKDKKVWVEKHAQFLEINGKPVLIDVDDGLDVG
ncbi:MAG: methionine--tRNA ligase [Candidatus Woesearchaeota archaeon]